MVARAVATGPCTFSLLRNDNPQLGTFIRIFSSSF